jgi:hypothetical protein
MRSARRRTSRSSRSRSSKRARGPRQRPRSQLPSRHADVALSALRDTPGRNGALLGLPSLQHRLRDLSALPSLRGGPARLLRSGSTAPPAARRRDPRLLGGFSRRAGDARRRSHPAPPRDRGPRSRTNARSAAGVRRGRRAHRRGARAPPPATQARIRCAIDAVRRRSRVRHCGRDRDGRVGTIGDDQAPAGLGRAALEPVERRRDLISRPLESGRDRPARPIQGVTTRPAGCRGSPAG